MQGDVAFAVFAVSYDTVKTNRCELTLHSRACDTSYITMSAVQRTASVRFARRFWHLDNKHTEFVYRQSVVIGKQKQADWRRSLS